MPLLTHDQFKQLTDDEYQAFMKGLNLRETYREELISMGLAKDEIRKLMNYYCKRDKAFVPERFRPIKKVKAKTKFHHGNTHFR